MSDLPAPLGNSTEDRWMAIVERVLATPNVPIDNLERILALRDREREVAALEDFNRSLAACQAAVKQIAKDKPNPAYKSRYSSLAAVDDEIRPIRERYGLGWLVSQAPADGAGNVRYQGIISKGRIEKTVYLEIDRAYLTSEGPRGGRVTQTGIQVVGSITSYMRRYLLMMAFDLVPADDIEDDDGESSRRGSWRPRDEGSRYPDLHREVRKAQAIISEGKGNGNGNGKAWIDRFEEGCDRAQSIEDCDRIFGREDVKLAESQLQGEELRRFDAIRKRTFARIFPVPGDPGDEQ